MDRYSKNAHLEAPVCQPDLYGEEPDDKEFSHEQWLAWYQSEFAGYEPSREMQLVEDDAGENEAREFEFACGASVEDVDRWFPGPIQVTADSLAEDRNTLRWLQRSGGNGRRWKRLGPKAEAKLGRKWIELSVPGRRRTSDLCREGMDGEQVVIGAIPFSVDEGAAEWLFRTRCDIRRSYIQAWRRKDEARKAALVNRDFAVRARHNARCWARAVCSYYGVDPVPALAMLDDTQKNSPVGWLGLESMCKAMFAGAEKDYLDARLEWERNGPAYWALDGKLISRPSKEEQDAWLDLEPVAPVYPTALVTSAKHIRKHHTVETVWSPPAPSEFERASVGHRSVRAKTAARRERLARAYKLAATVSVPKVVETETEWYATRKEWELSGDPLDTPEKVEVHKDEIAAYYAERRRRQVVGWAA